MKKDIKIIIPKSYPYKVTSRDKKQYIREMSKAIEQLDSDKNIDDASKKDILDTIPELFWDAKIANKKKYTPKKYRKDAK